MFSLLRQPQTRQVRERIVSLFNDFATIMDHETRDICPYINVLAMMHNLEENHEHEQHDLDRFKVLQFEDMVADLEATAVHIYCFVKAKAALFARCVDFVSSSRVEMSSWLDQSELWTAKNVAHGKLPAYEWKLEDFEIFSQMNDFHILCDTCLSELITEHESSFVLGNFDFMTWIRLRQSVHDSVIGFKPHGKRVPHR